MGDRRAARVERVRRRVVGPDLILGARHLPGSVAADEVDLLVERVVRGGHEAADVGHVRARRPRVGLDVVDACDRMVRARSRLPAHRRRRSGSPAGSRPRTASAPESASAPGSSTCSSRRRTGKACRGLIDAQRVAAGDVGELVVGGGGAAVEVDGQRRADLPAAGRRRWWWRRRRGIGRGPDGRRPSRR